MQTSADFELKSPIIKSLSAHAILILLLIIKGEFFHGDPIKIENSIRVDLVGLPQKQAELPGGSVTTDTASKQLPQKTSEPESKDTTDTTKLKPKDEAASKPNAVNLEKHDAKKTHKSQEAALKRLDALNKLDRQQRALQAAKALGQGSKPLAGASVSSGNALSGTSKLDHDQYLDLVESKVRQNWRPPRFLAKSELQVLILIFIDEQGKVTANRILKSSGNAVFDESALAAIEAAEPLPPPPESIKAVLAQRGVAIDLQPNH